MHDMRGGTSHGMNHLAPNVLVTHVLTAKSKIPEMQPTSPYLQPALLDSNNHAVAGAGTPPV